MGNDSVKQYSILFVDDESNVLMGIKRLLRNFRNEWDMEFAGSAAEALDRLAQRPFNIIVSDLRMPGTSGIELLARVKQLYPSMIRFILSGYGDTDMILQSVGVAHQFLAKPCDPVELQEALVRAASLIKLFSSEALFRIIGDGASLPTLPELYRDLSQALKAPNCSSKQIAEIIKKDVYASTRIIQLVNSAFFSLSQKVESISQAVTLLGAETINTLVLAAHIFEEYEESVVQEFGIREIYVHSIAVGGRARAIVLAETGDRKLSEEAMLAGIVHDLGKLALINSGNPEWRELYHRRNSIEVPFHVMEKERLGISHIEVGAYLLGLWGLSNRVVEAVAFHSEPSRAPGEPQFGSLCALHLANIFEKQAHSFVGVQKHASFDEAYLGRVGILERVEKLRSLCSKGIGTVDQHLDAEGER